MVAPLLKLWANARREFEATKPIVFVRPKGSDCAYVFGHDARLLSQVNGYRLCEEDGIINIFVIDLDRAFRGTVRLKRRPLVIQETETSFRYC